MTENININNLMSFSISQESPFATNYSSFHNFSPPKGYGTKSLKAKMSTAISPDSPKSFQLKHVPVVTNELKAEELSKGYYTMNSSDALKLYPPSSIITQEKRKFNYQDFNTKGHRNDFDFSTLKPSHLCDLLADKRPDVKNKSPFYSVYENQLKHDGFGLNRGPFTVDSNQSYRVQRFSEKLQSTLEERLRRTEKHWNIPLMHVNKSEKELKFDKNLLKKTLPTSLWANKLSMERFLKKPIKEEKNSPRNARLDSGKNDINRFEKALNKRGDISMGFTEMNTFEYLKKPKKAGLKIPMS
ncbi:unnamed protein product [Blepharisma stoltei]|uniref:Uncharacterized protein n=1 Tax=Blepharisma stoltei TaxID=1481888 RepID=A0AAU9INV3_9CILI|nr:unnamed protein product [Blepharisma stoltei]